MVKQPPFFLRLLNRVIPLLYSHLAWLYDTVAWLVSRGRWQQWQRAAFADLPRDRILEFGSGPGHLLSHLLKEGYDIWGMDPSPQMLLRASRRCLRSASSPRLIQARSQAVPLPAGRMHVILSAFPTEYIIDPASLAELHRILHPQGTIVVLPYAVPDPDNLFGRLTGWLLNVPPVESEFPSAWKQRFEAAGFQVKATTVDVQGDRVYRLELTKS